MGKKGKSGSKARVKLPKKVAGVKVPKELRKQAQLLVQFIDSPAGRELAAAGLTLAATRLAASAAAGAKGRARTSEPAGEPKSAPQPAETQAGDLGELLRTTVAEGARRFLAGFEEGRRTDQAGKSGPDEPGPKPKRLPRD